MCYMYLLQFTLELYTENDELHVFVTIYIRTVYRERFFNVKIIIHDLVKKRVGGSI
jgi:hypothetical protein